MFPHLDDPSPIFGFDMIAGPARVTGIFLDLSPVTARPAGARLRDVVTAAARLDFATRRALPPWGDIFSADFLAVRPAGLEEVRRAIALAHGALDALLRVQPDRMPCSTGKIAAGQTRYIMGQRSNEHTLRALAGIIGHEQARRFIDQVLFPAVPEIELSAAA